jgi:nicotinamide mononucleotide (NMN) deamidase PncC
MVAAELGRIPGISEHFCGSLVVYRNDSKTKWLGIEPSLLNDPSLGPVSECVTLELAHSALRRTPEATLAGAVTGHLGPGAQGDLDGVIYCAIAFASRPLGSLSRRIHLDYPTPMDAADTNRRFARQVEATRHLIDMLIESMEGTPPQG